MKENIKQIKEQKKEQYAEQIRTWQSKYGPVKIFWIEDGKETKAIFFRQPNRFELAAAENLSTNSAGQIDFYKKGERHISDCYLGGDLSVEQMLADTSVYIPAMKFTILGLIEEKKSSWESC